MNKKSPSLFWLGFVGSIGVVSAAVIAFTYSLGHQLPDPGNGFFYSTGVGNAGIVNMNGASLNGTQLVGTITLQSVGSATFNPGSQIIAPTTGRVTDFWTVTGTMNSPNAGTIYLYGVGTDLCYDPVNQSFQGYGWNKGVGKVPLGNGDCSATGAIALTGAAFQGKVKIIGNAGGTTIFDSMYQQGSRFSTSIFNNTLQQVRRNVGLLSRNLTTAQKNTSFDAITPTPTRVGDKIFFINDTATLRTLTFTSSLLNSARTVIVIGGDVIIEGTGGVQPTSFSTNSKAIIVLKNSKGVGGNISVNRYVKRIQATLLAEGTVYSGDSPTALYNDTMAETTDLPQNQLWIEGSLLSRNTIGGASRGSPLCPLPGASCTFETSIRYDMNYFRAVSQPFNSIYRAYTNNTLDQYSIIIDYDDRNLTSPPPGLE